MQIIRLSRQEIELVADELNRAVETDGTVLVAIDGFPHEARPSFKVKVNEGVWSPPLGQPVR